MCELSVSSFVTSNTLIFKSKDVDFRISFVEYTKMRENILSCYYVTHVIRINRKMVTTNYVNAADMFMTCYFSDVALLC